MSKLPQYRQRPRVVKDWLTDRFFPRKEYKQIQEKRKKSVWFQKVLARLQSEQDCY